MSRTGIFVSAAALLAGGVLLIVPQLAGRHRAEPAGEVISVSVEEDEAFQADEAWLTRYTLTERSGRKFNSESLAGKVQVVNFFFTACPTACPLQTQKVQELDRQFGPSGVHFLSITCDPDRDTPAVLNQYAAKYNADPDRWLFLTGDFPYIQRIAAEVYWSPLEERGHREDFVVVDKWGKVRGNFPWNNSQQIGAMKQLLTELLAETEPPAEAASIAVPAADDSDSAEAPAAAVEEASAEE